MSREGGRGGADVVPADDLRAGDLRQVLVEGPLDLVEAAIVVEVLGIDVEDDNIPF